MCANKIYRLSDERWNKEIKTLNSYYLKNNLRGILTEIIILDFDPTQPFAKADLVRPEEIEEVEEDQNILEQDDGNLSKSYLLKKLSKIMKYFKY